MEDILYNWDTHKVVWGASVRFFDRLGPERFIPSYAIISANTPFEASQLQDMGVDIRVVPSSQGGENVQTMIDSTEFQSLIDAERQGRELFLYINNVTPLLEKTVEKMGVTLLANLASLRHEFENKRNFRIHLSRYVKVPEYDFWDKKDVGDLDSAYNKWSVQFGNFVLQDESETMSGARGTRIVRSRADFMTGVSDLLSLPGACIVVSKFIPGDVVSMQGCILAEGIFVGPLQKQFVGFPALAKPGYAQFSGGQWGYSSFSEDTRQEAFETMQKIGKFMQERGYKGLFGVDLIVGDDKNLYAIEVNARPTALTPLLSMVQRENNATPLLVAHMLEHADCSYAIPHPIEYQKKITQEVPLSYGILHNLQVNPVRMRTILKPGIYMCDENHAISFLRFGFELEHLTGNQEFLITDVQDANVIVKPGKILLRILTRGNMLDESGAISATYERIIQWIHDHYSDV